MATRKHLSKTVIEAIPTPASGRTVVYDSNPKFPGLLVEKTHTGATSFYLYRRVQGRPQRLRLGGWPAMTIDQAREECARRTLAIETGADPAAERRAARGALTFAEVFATYLEHYAKQHKRTWREDEQKYQLDLQRPLGNKTLGDIDKASIVTIHQRIGVTRKSPGAANRTLALISKVFNYARHTLDLPCDNPAVGIRKFKEESRERFLDAGELQRFFAAIDAPETKPVWRDFFKVLLWTGARSGNVRTMQWAFVDLDAGKWQIPASAFKSGYAMTVILPPQAVEILRRRLSERKHDCPWVFPSERHSGSGHIEVPQKPWAELLKRAGLGDVRIHDLRRTMGSWQAATGANLSVIGKALGHRTVATTAIYARLTLDPVRESVNKAAEAMMAAAKAKPATKAG